MWNLFKAFKFRGNPRESDHGAERNNDGRWGTSRTAGSTSHKMLFVNKTDRKLALVEKFGPVYGTKRYEIPVKGEIEVDTERGDSYSFYKLLLYAIDEVQEQGQDKTRKCFDTNITINWGQVGRCKKIVVSAQGSEYKLEYVN